MNKSKHTYQEDFEVGVEYTYNNKSKKVYNIKKLKTRFQSILDSYKKKQQ